MEKKTEKKSLSVEELAKKIKEVSSTEEGCCMSETELQKAIREKGFSFAKDKWNKALDIALESCCEECAGCSADDDDEETDEISEDGETLLRAIDIAEENAESIAITFFEGLKEASLENDSTMMTPADCPATTAEVYRLLDLACETGLLEKVVCYKLTDEALKDFKKEAEKKAKGKKGEKK